jgi:hypothetical protein
MRNSIARALAPLVLWSAGCSPETTKPSTTTTSEGQKSQAPAGTTAVRSDAALVRFINADSDAKGMDVWSSGVRIFSNVGYKMIAPYMDLLAHVGEFQLRETGGTEGLAVGRREIFPGRHYTMVALPRENHSSRLAILSDDLRALEPGQARVRLINATADVNDLDLYIEDTGTRIGHGVDPSVASSITDVKPGMLEIRQAGQPAFQRLSNLKVEADRLYTFIVTGTALNLDVLRIEDRIER